MNCNRRSDRSSRLIKRPIRRQDIFVCPRCLTNYSMPTIGDLRNRITRGETTARSAGEAALKSGHKLNQQLNAVPEIYCTRALNRAAKIDQTADKSSLPLAGVPVAIKDNICVRGMQTSCGSPHPRPEPPT